MCERERKESGAPAFVERVRLLALDALCQVVQGVAHGVAGGLQ
jgi:hypothetical protein